MNFKQTTLSGSYEIELTPFVDERGWFARYFCKDEFKDIGHKGEWVQLNHSVTNKKGTVRGLHFQVPPYAEVKLVRCIVGSVFDVIVDLRKDSPSFLKWFGAELSAVKKNMLYIPEGFAHGFQCLEDHCELLYHHTAFYNSTAERGIRYDDPRLAIKWPFEVSNISKRDLAHPLLNNQFKGI